MRMETDSFSIFSITAIVVHNLCYLLPNGVSGAFRRFSPILKIIASLQTEGKKFDNSDVFMILLQVFGTNILDNTFFFLDGFSF